jgi:NADH-quinone oxidoreductase subunit L
MALALIVLAIGSVVAGYVGVPAALGGSNRIEHYLEPSFEARHGVLTVEGERTERAPLAGERSEPQPLAAERSEAAPLARHGGAPSGAEHSEATEFALMAVSIAVAFIGIGIAWYFFISNPSAADRVAESAAPVHNLLLHKYYVDELYDATIVQPIVAFSRGALWKVVDAEVIDGAVNGAGAFVNTSAGLLRRLQTGSVRVYAASLTLGVVLVLGFYLWRLAQGATF